MINLNSFDGLSEEGKPSHSVTNFSPKIALFAASCRQNSINKTLVRAVELIMKSKGVQTTVIDLADFEMPLFCGDDEIPENARALAHLLSEFDGIFIATPELNGSPPPIMKNLIDWTSMLGSDHFRNPVYAIGSATPGPLSGVMAMKHLSYILNRLGSTVIPIAVGTGNAKEAFDQQGNLVAKPSCDLALDMVDQLIKRITEKRLCQLMMTGRN